MSEQMKAVVFEGITYRVPVWVNWMARDQDGSICGYQCEISRGQEFFFSLGGRVIDVFVPVEDESWRNSAARV